MASPPPEARSLRPAQGHRPAISLLPRFRPFDAEGRRLLLIPWLGYPRKDGDRNDCYVVFSGLVQMGELLENWETLQRELDGAVH